MRCSLNFKIKSNIANSFNYFYSEHFDTIIMLYVLVRNTKDGIEGKNKVLFLLLILVSFVVLYTLS